MRKKYKRGLYLLSTAAVMIAASTLSGQSYKWGMSAAWGSDDQLCSDVVTDGAGNVYMVGTFEVEAIFDYALPTPGNIVFTNADPGGGFADGFLAKYDRSNHDVLWALQFQQDAPAVSKNERVYAVAAFPDGGNFSLFVGGTYSSAMTLPTTSGSTITLPAGAGQSGFVAKYNSEGVLQWASRIDGSSTDIVYDVSVSTDGSGGATVYACGSFIGASLISQSCTLTPPGTTGGTEAFLMRFDANTGIPQWGKVMSAPGNDAFYAVASADNGDVVTTGMVRGTGTIHTSTTATVTCVGADAFVMARYSVNGTYAHHLSGGGGTFGAGFYDTGAAAAIDGNGDAYIAGYFCGTCSFGALPTVNNLGAAGTKDFFIAKITAAGTPVYLRGGGTSNDGDAIQSLAVNNLGSRVYAAGNYRGNLSYNSSGTLLSAYNIPSPNLDGFLLTVNADDLTHIGDERFGGASHDDNGRSVSVNAAEDIYVGSSASSLNWHVGSSPALAANSDGTGGSFEAELFRWDHSNWPALSSNYTCVHTGIGEWWNASAGEWKISMGGFFNGPLVSFMTGPGTYTTLASTQDALGNYTQDAYITTCNTFGNYESFVKVMGGDADEVVYDHTVDASGNNYFTGHGSCGAGLDFTFVGTGAPTYAATTGVKASFIGKYTNAAGYGWGVFIKPLAGSASAQAQGITVDNNGNVYVTGGCIGNVQFGSMNTTGTNPVQSPTAGASSDIFVAKYDNLGNLLWVRIFASSTAGGSEKGNSISVDNGSPISYYVTGEYNTTGTLTFGSNALTSTGGGKDIFVMKGNGSSNSAGGGPAIAGIKRAILNDDIGYDVISPNTVECYITGVSNTNAACFIGSVNFSGTPSWNWAVNNGAGLATAISTDLVMGNNGYLFVSGYTLSTGTLSFGALSEAIDKDAFLVSLTSWGGTPTCLEVYETVTNPDMFTEAIALETGSNSPDHGDNVLVAGSSGTSPSNHESYAHKITAEGCAVSERRPNPIVPSAVTGSVQYNSLVYPNPLNGNATLEIRTDVDFSSTPFTVVITDMTGREVSRMNGLTTKLVNINAENFSDGLYYYQVMQENKMISNGKMVVSH
jgi:hypothetical protein